MYSFMDVHTALRGLGLSEGEIKVYLALLKLGSSPVSKVKEETRLHRTTIYDFVEKLLNKGLINYVVKANVKYYNAAHPNKLREFLREKQDHLEQVLPDLDKLAKFQQEEVKVEVYKGKEGLKTAMLEVIRTKSETIGIGIDDSLWKRELPVFIEQYQRLMEENGVTERILTRANADYYFHTDSTQYKFIPEHFFSPLSTLVFGNKVEIVIWEPSLTTIIVESKKLADSYRKHFDGLWNQASMTYKGIDEVKGLFYDIAHTLHKGEEYTVFGVPPSADKHTPFFNIIMDKLGEKGVKCRGIFDERAVEQIGSAQRNPYFEVRVVGKDHMSPAEVSIYGTKTAIILWADVPEAFVIDNASVADSFRKYFEILWKTARKA